MENKINVEETKAKFDTRITVDETNVEAPVLDTPYEPSNDVTPAEDAELSTLSPADGSKTEESNKYADFAKIVAEQMRELESKYDANDLDSVVSTYNHYLEIRCAAMSLLDEYVSSLDPFSTGTRTTEDNLDQIISKCSRALYVLDAKRKVAKKDLTEEKYENVTIISSIPVQSAFVEAQEETDNFYQELERRIDSKEDVVEDVAEYMIGKITSAYNSVKPKFFQRTEKARRQAVSEAISEDIITIEQLFEKKELNVAPLSIALSSKFNKIDEKYKNMFVEEYRKIASSYGDDE